MIILQKFPHVTLQPGFGTTGLERDTYEQSCELAKFPTKGMELGYIIYFLSEKNQIFYNVYCGICPVPLGPP